VIVARIRTARSLAVVSFVALGVVTLPLPAAAQTVVVSCPFEGGGGDLTERGVHVTGYSGTNLDTVTLKYTAGVTGSYTITLTARLGAYNGTVIGTSTATENFTAQVAKDILFSFGAAPVPAGSTIAFVQSVTGPGAMFFDVGNGPLGDPTYTGCPGVVETEGTTPPLDEFRRASVGLTITQLDVPAPTITSFTPTAGPIGTSVVIIGTNFSGTGFTTESVTFNGVTAPFIVNSATQITATVPTGATSGLIRVTTPGGTATSSANFTVQSAAPTITSFSPTSGPVGTSVVIRGTGFTGVTSVTFNGVSAAFTVNSSTQITATVPATATTGPIRVTTPAGTATTTTNFTVTTGPEPSEKHRSNVTLRLRGHLVATGQVNVPDGTGACERRRLVKIQRRNEGNWRTVGKDRTSSNGSYKEGLADREGKYRAVLTKSRLDNGDRCLGDVSRKRTHNHPTPTVSAGGGDDDGDEVPNCTPGYSPCIPPGPDVDCAGGGGNGPRYVEGPIRVTGSDPYGLDGDNDGIGCET
jgi:hypothetical protein